MSSTNSGASRCVKRIVVVLGSSINTLPPGLVAGLAAASPAVGTGAAVAWAAGAVVAAGLGASVGLLAAAGALVAAASAPGAAAGGLVGPHATLVIRNAARAAADTVRR